MSIDVKPNTAFVTCPDAVAMSDGSAKNARYVSEFPSISISVWRLSMPRSENVLRPDTWRGDRVRPGASSITLIRSSLALS